MIDFDGILSFWFGQTDERRAAWWVADDAFDEEIRALFASDLAAVLHGKHNPQNLTRDQRLAIILLTDQFPRNMFRGTPRAFSADVYAFDAAQYLIARGQDETLPPVRRQFVYMPFLHSEDIRVQGQSMMLFRKLVAEAPDMKLSLQHAEEHYETIAKFGRFPHRNAILGRPSTRAELAFLAKKTIAN